MIVSHLPIHAGCLVSVSIKNGLLVESIRKISDCLRVSLSARLSEAILFKFGVCLH